ncbi:MAG TPA: carbon storage regulator [Tepidisphaeraceae bacterium]|nr:carbon storage regulator [Tepidisphaeraceae bacterium]
MFVLTRGVDEWIVIGDDILISPTDIDENSVRVIAKGRMLGGSSDGGTFQQVHELTRGQSFPIGPMIVVTLVDVRGDKVRLGINVPQHLAVHRKESPDPIKDE